MPRTKKDEPASTLILPSSFPYEAGGVGFTSTGKVLRLSEMPWSWSSAAKARLREATCGAVTWKPQQYVPVSTTCMCTGGSAESEIRG